MVAVVVGQDAGGLGFAKEAVASAAAFSFEVLGLHRLQAATLLDNERSQAVLRAAGFEEFGVAPSYLRIDGRWRDHRLFAITVEECGDGLLRRLKGVEGS